MSSRTLAIGLGLAHCTDCRKRRSRALLGRIDGVTDEGKIFDSLSQDNCAIWKIRYGAMHSKLVPWRPTCALRLERVRSEGRGMAPHPVSINF